MRRIHVVLLPSVLLLAPIFLWAESGTPSLGYAGVNSGIGSDHGGQDCSTCHSSFGAANSDSTGSLAVTVGDYNPGIAQTIRIIVQHPVADRWGFQLTIREVSDETISSGSFSLALANDPVQVVCDDGSKFGSASCSANQRQFAEHNAAPRGAAGAAYEFDVVWNPPSQEVGKLDVYVAAVAANGDGTPSGDRVYTFKKTISNIGACSVGKKPTLQTVLNGASFQGPFSSKAMVSIFGLGFQASGYTRSAGLGDFVNGGFPTQLGCVAVQVTGPGIPQPVLIPISYVQQDQINAQMPQFNGTGPVTLQVIENPGGPNQLMSDAATLNAMQALAPAFFVFSGSTSIATRLAGSAQIIANPAQVPGARPARPGEIVSLYATGFGDTNPQVAAGQLASGQASLTNPVIVTIGTTTLSASQVQYAGLTPGSISGLYQFNVQVPPGTPNGAVPVSISINGVTTQTGATIPVQQ
jgi:uncharacterized protein (TIGR03437 family)